MSLNLNSEFINFLTIVWEEHDDFNLISSDTINAT